MATIHETGATSEEAARGWPERFVLVALVGIGLIALAQVFMPFTVLNDMAGNAAISALLSTFGSVAIGGGFALAGALGRGLSNGARIALLVAGAYFTTTGGLVGLLSGIGNLF